VEREPGKKRGNWNGQKSIHRGKPLHDHLQEIAVKTSLVESQEVKLKKGIVRSKHGKHRPDIDTWKA
jgi:hypothetical protein